VGAADPQSVEYDDGGAARHRYRLGTRFPKAVRIS
jgi:hypothetical protein